MPLYAKDGQPVGGPAFLQVLAMIPNGEMELEPWPRRKPGASLRVFVGGVVVDPEMDGEIARHIRLRKSGNS